MQLPFRSYWRLLGAYLRPQWPVAALLGFLLSGSIGVQLYSPRVLKGIIDGALGGAPAAALTAAALLFLVLALRNQALMVVATYVSNDLGWRATNRLRSDLTLHALRLDLSYHKARSSGEMIERIDGDVTPLANFFAQFVVQVAVRCADGGCAGGAVHGRLAGRAGPHEVFAANQSGGAASCTRHVAMPGWQAARQSSAEFFGFVGERLAGLEDIRGNGAGPYTMRGFHVLMRRRLQAELKAGREWITLLFPSGSSWSA